MLPLRSHSFRGARWGPSADRKLILARGGELGIPQNGPLCVEDQLPIGPTSELFPDRVHLSALQRGTGVSLPGL